MFSINVIGLSLSVTNAAVFGRSLSVAKLAIIGNRLVFAFALVDVLSRPPVGYLRKSRGDFVLEKVEIWSWRKLS